MDPVLERNLQAIAGSHQLKITFSGREDAIRNNHDILNESLVFERMEARLKIAQTDIGKKLQAQADDLLRLLDAYKLGAVTEDHKE